MTRERISADDSQPVGREDGRVSMVQHSIRIRGEEGTVSVPSSADGRAPGEPAATRPNGDAGQGTNVRHCRQCGHAVHFLVPPDDNRYRAVCPGCRTVHYENPLNVVGTVSTWGDHNERVLLCRRAIEPRIGYWTLPAGFMELGETAAQGAVRETQEEAGACVEVLGLFALIDVLPAGQVHLLFRARMLAPVLQPGAETLEARLFEEHEVPWDELAFRSVTLALRHHFACLERGSDTLLVERID
jgi:ADP-ribose pyrophosphatase YjhB (NUDIX family)